MEKEKIVEIWMFKPSNPKIIVMKSDIKYATRKKLLKCDRIEHYAVEKIDGSVYTLVMDEYGSYKQDAYNECATNFLLKLKLNWSMDKLRGNYMIYKSKTDEEGESEGFDMDLKPSEFIKLFNEIQLENHRAREEYFKSHGIKVIELKM